MDKGWFKVGGSGRLWGGGRGLRGFCLEAAFALGTEPHSRAHLEVVLLYRQIPQRGARPVEPLLAGRAQRVLIRRDAHLEGGGGGGKAGAGWVGRREGE